MKCCCCCCENSPLSCDEIVDGSIAMSDGQRGLVPTSRRSLGIHPTRGWMRKKRGQKRSRRGGGVFFWRGGGRRGRGAGGYRLLLLASPFVTPPAVEFC